MSTPQPITYERIMEMIHELTLSQKETDRQIKKTSKEVESLKTSVGRLVENMIGGGNIIAQFQALGYDVTAHSQNKNFGKKGTTDSGEIDWLLENGDIAILVEVKTALKKDEIDEHIERIEKYRRYGNSSKKRLIGAVAGAFVAEQDINYAHKRGLLVIVQSGEAFKVLDPPPGFVAKEW